VDTRASGPVYVISFHVDKREILQTVGNLLADDRLDELILRDVKYEIIWVDWLKNYFKAPKRSEPVANFLVEDELPLQFNKKIQRSRGSRMRSLFLLSTPKIPSQKEFLRWRFICFIIQEFNGKKANSGYCLVDKFIVVWSVTISPLYTESEC
jgi:hypothetical protein